MVMPVHSNSARYKVIVSERGGGFSEYVTVERLSLASYFGCPCRNVGLDTIYPDRFPGFSSVAPAEIRDCTSNYTTTASFGVFYILLLDAV